MLEMQISIKRMIFNSNLIPAIFILIEIGCCNFACTESKKTAPKTQPKLWDSTQTIDASHLKKAWDIYNCQQYDSLLGYTRPVSIPDQKLLQKYPYWIEKGNWFDDRRLTLMVSKTNFLCNESIRVFHVFEDVKVGREIFTTGPKKIRGEYINDHLVSAPFIASQDPWAVDVIDGETPHAPDVDYNFEITTYRFSKSGIYRIQWKLGDYRSNVLVIHVSE
jgi:hypothetical protein